MSEINHFEALGMVYISGRGIIFFGQAPFDMSFQEDKKKLYQRPWKITHESTTDELWQLTGVEYTGGLPIKKGRGIGLLVRKWES